jgi:Ca2+-binding EF-hand superfamily protein
MEEYTCVYNKNFHNYLDKETLNIYVFDSSIPIEVDTEGKDVEMVRQNIENDLIGVCKIKLIGLILNKKIEGKFPIINEENKNNVDKIRGYLIVNITAEEIFLEENEKKYRNDLDQKLVEGIHPLLDKLASILKDKGLKMNSAFNIFDKDHEDQVSLANFRNIAYDFNFEQKELDKLIEVVFGNRVVLDRQDFYQLFNNLLPFEDDLDNNQRTKVLGEQTQISFNIIDKQNNSMKTTGALKEVEVNESNSGIMTNFNNFNNYNNNKTILNTQNMSNYNNVGRRKSKTMKEIMLKIEDYMFYFGKKTASDLFKIFDRDANLKVGIKELADGFARMGISLNPEELDMIWKNIVGKSDKTSFGFEEFMAFYEKHKVKK